MINTNDIIKMSKKEIISKIIKNGDNLTHDDKIRIMVSVIEDKIICDEIIDESCYKYTDCIDCLIAHIKKEYKGDDNND